MAVPTMPDSASGVSMQRSGPNSSCRPDGGAEDAAETADVLAQHDHARVAAHLDAQGVVHRLDQCSSPAWRLATYRNPRLSQVEGAQPSEPHLPRSGAGRAAQVWGGRSL